MDYTLLYLSRYTAPCGIIWLGASDGKLCMADWQGGRSFDKYGSPKRLKLFKAYIEMPDDEIIRATSAQLDEYFMGLRQLFDIPLCLTGTEFQKHVWDELLKVPYGKTLSYSDVAKAIGMPQATRAVANAIGNNPVSIIVPCHRIIGKDKSLTGYAGGISAKKTLLALERKYSAN